MPLVMGILNITPDSFYAGSRKQTETAIEDRIREILSEGGDWIDIGGYSSRPDAAEVERDACLAYHLAARAEQFGANDDRALAAGGLDKGRRIGGNLSARPRRSRANRRSSSTAGCHRAAH